MAHLDPVRGRHEVLAFGLAAAWRSEYARLLRKRYGIEMRVVAGCCVKESLVAYVDSYNAVSADAASRKFGHNVFQEIVIDARGNLNVQQRREKRKSKNPGLGLHRPGLCC